MPAAVIGTGLGLTSCWKWSVLTTRNAIWCGSAGSMPGQEMPEYWIVDPATEQIIVLHLEGTAYVEHGMFTRGTQATSVLLEGFTSGGRCRAGRAVSCHGLAPAVSAESFACCAP